MAITRRKDFDITGKAMEAIEAARPEADPGAGRDAAPEAARRGRGRPAGSGSARKIAKPCSVTLYEDQRRAIHSIEYAMGRHNMMSVIIRDAVDEYLERHSDELGAGEHRA